MYDNKMKECIERNNLNKQRKCDHDYEFNNQKKKPPTSVKDKTLMVIKKKTRVQSAGALVPLPHPFRK